MSVNSGIVGALYYQSSTTHIFADKSATLQADKKTLIIDDSTVAGFVRDSSLFIVEDSLGTLTGYTIQYDRVIFAEEQDDLETYTISGTYAELTQYASCYEWGLDIKEKINTYNVFGNEWEKKVKGVKGWTATAKHYEVLDEITVDQDQDIVIRLFWDIDNYNSWVGYIKKSGLKISSKADGLSGEQEVSMEGSEGLIYCNYAVA